MGKIALYKKRYAIYGKVEMSVLIPLNNAKLRVNFANGVITPYRNYSCHIQHF